MTPEERFWVKVDTSGPVPEYAPHLGPCWLWTACQNGSGYGSFTSPGYRVAHRFSYELLVGPVPDGLNLDHLCRVRHCVNPTHLEAVTPQVNVLRGAGLCAENARKTHCVKGHEFTPENIYRKAEGGRECLRCKRDLCREYARRRKARERAEARA